MKVRQALQAFDKLGLEIREGRDTLAFFRWEGQIILWTKVPHKRGELKGKLPYLVRQQLHLNEPQFRELIACPMGRAEYIEVIRSKGLLPSSEGE
jgi:hypothetical protein